MDAKEFVASRPDTSGPSPSKYKRNDQVVLAEFDNGDEIIPEARGIVQSVDWHDYSHLGRGDADCCYMYVVEVFPQYRTDEDDDGLRELSEDQIRGIDHRLAVSYNLTDRNSINLVLQVSPHTKMFVENSTLEFSGDHTIATRVNNAINVYLTESDIIYVDKFGRVNAFEANGRCYTIAES